jgi:hypothetical protein
LEAEVRGHREWEAEDHGAAADLVISLAVIRAESRGRSDLGRVLAHNLTDAAAAFYVPLAYPAAVLDGRKGAVSFRYLIAARWMVYADRSLRTVTAYELGPHVTSKVYPWRDGDIHRRTGGVAEWHDIAFAGPKLRIVVVKNVRSKYVPESRDGSVSALYFHLKDASL